MTASADRGPAGTTLDDRPVRELDRVRREAMVAADVDTLRGLFAEELTWVHATGRLDDRGTLLEAIGSGATRYLAIDVRDERCRELGDVALLSGVVSMQLQVDGDARQVESRYTIVWHRTGPGWRVVSWQSTSLRRSA